MLLQHQLVVHLVDVIARQDHHELGIVRLDDIDVLKHGVGRAIVPLRFGDALAGRQDIETLVALGTQEVPATLQVTDETVRLVLRGDADAANARVEGIRKGEVDDARLAPEKDSGLCSAIGELIQSRAAATGQHIGHGVAREVA